MPWDIKRDSRCSKSKPYGVVKRADNELEGCHATRVAAQRQLAALNAAELGQVKMSDETTQATEETPTEEKGIILGPGVPDGTGPLCAEVVEVDMGPISFSEMKAEDSARQAAYEVNLLASEFPRMVRRIFNRPDIEDKDAALETLAEEFIEMSQETLDEIESKEAGEGEGVEPPEETDDKAVWTTKYVNDLPNSAFLYVEPGEKDSEGKTVPRSKRHFPYKDASGKVDLPHLRNAIARIPQSNASGLTAAKKRSLQERARRLLQQQQGKERNLLDKAIDAIKSVFGDEPEPDPSNFFIWKEGDRYRWFAAFSNNFRDKDNPPEILAEAAHKEFIEAVDAKEWPYPELLHWHTPGTRWGVADWLSYADNFAMASGWIDRGHEKEAEAVAALPGVKVSHGMPISEIQRDGDDPTVITRYRSIEISDLPGWAAANPLTGFKLIGKEVTMPIPDEKRTYLQEAGLSDAQIAQIEADLEGKAKEAGDAGLEQKEADAAPETEVQPEPVATEAGQPLTREEAAEAIIAATKPLQDALLALADEVKAVKESDEAKFAKAVADTPAASLVDLVRQRAVGAEETKVDGRSALAKGPKVPEEAKQKALPVSSVPWINEMLAVGQEVGQ